MDPVKNAYRSPKVSECEPYQPANLLSLLRFSPHLPLLRIAELPKNANSSLVKPCTAIEVSLKSGHESTCTLAPGAVDRSISQASPIQKALKEASTNDHKPSHTAQNNVDISACTQPKWIQLAGHEGSLIPTGNGSVLKEYSESEASCLIGLQSGDLGRYVPAYQGIRQLNGIQYVQMQDLLHNIESPSMMDCKMGQRTYLEAEMISEGTATSQLRPDMYAKMIALDPNAPTAEEHHKGAVSKSRYMRWRETLSSTAELGFRIEAVKKPNLPTVRDFQLVCSRITVKSLLEDFINSDRKVCNGYVTRLRSLREALEASVFFAEHEFIGSSLLFVHDAHGWTSIWMIDFAKTAHLPNTMLDHRKPWSLGNHEDGYLVGLDNLISLFDELYKELPQR